MAHRGHLQVFRLAEWPRRCRERFQCTIGRRTGRALPIRRVDEDHRKPKPQTESGATYEAGLDAELAGFKPSLTYFYTDYNNKITGGFPATVDGDHTWTTYENVKGAILSAFEGSLSYKKSFTCNDMQIGLRPFVNFVYYTQREIEDPSYTKILKSDTVPYVPLWDAAGGIEVSFNHKVALLFTGFYTGDEKQENFNYLSPTYSQSMDKGGFAVFSAKLTYRPAKALELFLACDNLTDKNYAFVDGYPMPGRSFRGGIQFVSRPKKRIIDHVGRQGQSFTGGRNLLGRPPSELPSVLRQIGKG